MQVIYTAPHYNSQNPAGYNLCIAIEEEGCAVAVHDTKDALLYLGYNDLYLPMKENESAFFDFIRSNDVFKHQYEKTNIVLQGDKNTLVPQNLYDDLYTDAYLRHLHTIEKNEITKAVPLHYSDAMLVYAVKDYLFYPARSKYSDAAIETPVAGYIRQSAKHYPNWLNVFIEHGKLHIIHCDNSRLMFFNTFPFSAVDEGIYFILNYYKTFNIAYTQLPIMLHGHVHPQMREILNQYAGKNEIAEYHNKNANPPHDFRYNYLIDYTY